MANTHRKVHRPCSNSVHSETLWVSTTTQGLKNRTNHSSAAENSGFKIFASQEPPEILERSPVGYDC